MPKVFYVQRGKRKYTYESTSAYEPGRVSIRRPSTNTSGCWTRIPGKFVEVSDRMYIHESGRHEMSGYSDRYAYKYRGFLPMRTTLALDM